MRGRIVQQLQNRERGDGFARAGFTDDRQGLALGDMKGNAVDGERLPAALAEGDGKILDGKKGSAHAKVFLGSKASRTASPMKISSDSIRAITKKPDSPSQGACRLALPCASSSPSEGEPGGRPKPRKSSEVSVVIEPFMMKGRKVSVATMAFGSRCLTMILRLESPSARAARTYSKLRARRNSARTTPTSATQENSRRMPSSTKKLGVITAATMIN